MNEEIELPEELFELFGENRKYRFINLKGKETEMVLNKGDYLLRKKCPLDGTNLVAVDDGVYEHYEHCYCCGGPSTDVQGEMAEDWVTQEYTKQLQKEIESERNKIQKLERLLEISSNRNSEILKINRDNLLYSNNVNKPNLSAQQIENININSQKILKIHKSFSGRDKVKSTGLYGLFDNEYRKTFGIQTRRYLEESENLDTYHLIQNLPDDRKILV